MKLFYVYLNASELKIAVESLAALLCIGKFPGAIIDPDTTILTEIVGGLPQNLQVTVEIIP